MHCELTVSSPSTPVEVSRKSDHPIIDQNASIIRTWQPPTKDQIVDEKITLFFPTVDILTATLSGPISIDGTVIDKLLIKLREIVGKPTYPSHLARLIYEAAFEDANGLTPKERTDNVGYVLSNLGQNNQEITQSLLAFYYGYSFAKFAPVR